MRHVRGRWARCWRKRCFKCAIAWARQKTREVEYGKFCIACAKKFSEQGRAETLREEAEAYELARSRSEAPTGAEPALQGLLNWLPRDPAADPLPAYSEIPEALAPVHCRLCLANCTRAPSAP